MSLLNYCLFLILPASLVISYHVGGTLKFLPLAFVFIGVPALDYLLPKFAYGITEDIKEKYQKPVYSLILPYLYVLLHFSLLIFVSTKIMKMSSWPNIGYAAFVFGLMSGGLGFTVGHELCHKKDKVSRFLADLLLVSVCYQHYAIEHVKGHHLHVGTKNDPASAKKGEGIYTFLPRTLWGSFISAFGIEKRRVKKQWWKHKMIRGLGGSLLFVMAFAFIGGEKLASFFLIQAFVAILLLEVVNYVEHYGLYRKKNSKTGRYEKVTPIHSWNSDLYFSNALLFNLQRHSDHHANVNLPFPLLKDHPQSPMLPVGYPGMVLLALVPPLWFRVMDPKVEEWERVNNYKLSSA